MNREWVYKILEDIENRDFKNCKKDCCNYDGHGTICKYFKECSWYYYKHSEEFSFEDLMEGIREGLVNEK